MPSPAHVYEKDFELYRTGVLPNVKDSIIEAHLGEYRPCGVDLNNADEFLHALALLSDNQATHEERDKRREHRFVTDEPAVLQILSPFSDENSDVRILDVSKNGLRLHVASPVMVGSLVKMKLENYIAFGAARYCVAAPEGFFVGVQLHDYVSRKSI